MHDAMSCYLWQYQFSPTEIDIKVMKRINVVGTSATGKSTFSRALAEKLGLHYIELDNLILVR